MIKIKTYYQKHRQINAFQFDGTWDQLERELNPELWAEFLLTMATHNGDRTTYDQTTNYIQTLKLFDIHWPETTVKMKPYQFLNRRLRKRINYQVRYYKRPQTLHSGDYVSVQISFQMHHKNKKKIKRLHLSPRQSQWCNRRTILKIIPQNHFESQWSKTPIKPLRGD